MRLTFDERMRKILEARRDALLDVRERNVAGEDELLAEREPDVLDRGSETAAARVLGILAESERLEVERIDAALARLAAGSYGVCVRCGEPIHLERLEAVPEALFCVECGDAARPRPAWG